MPNENNITLRSEKGSYLTFEDMDLNLLELRDFMTEYSTFVSNNYTNHVADFNALQTDYNQYKIDSNVSIDTLNQNVIDINNDQAIQDGRITQNESDIAAIKTHLGI